MSELTKEKIYKYRINEILQALPFSDNRRAVALLPNVLGISKNTFINYRSFLIDDISDIPHSIVCDLERFFALPPNGLQNFKSNITSLADLKNLNDTPGEDDLSTKYGLTKAEI